MKAGLFKLFIATILILITINGNTQIKFEKGYFLKNNDERVECLIKNTDWKDNPTSFKYKLSETADIVTADIKSVKEFGIYNNSKFIKANVNIDKTGDIVENITTERNPIFVIEEIFLKVLIEGKATLFLYENNNLQIFFYRIENNQIDQLIYKGYLTENNEIKKNNYYKQQLFNNLKCETIETKKLENLDYTKNSLIKIFTEFNKCNNSIFNNYELKEKRKNVYLSAQLRFNNVSLKIENSSSNNQLHNYKQNLQLSIGSEIEFILPFNKNKWSISLQPTYQKFSQSKTTYETFVSGGKLISTVNYQSIEIPLILRHYFFLNKKVKLFANAGYVFDLSFNSSLDYKRADNSNYLTLDIKSKNNFAFGAGAKLNNKFSAELRYNTTRNILANYYSYFSKYQITSIIFSYTLF